MSFNNDIKKFNHSFEEGYKAVVTGTFLDLAGKIIKRSPVGNISLWKVKRKPKGYAGGRFRANWTATLNRPSTSKTSSKDKSGRKAIKSAKTTTLKYKLGDSLFLVNNLPYSIALEDGWSKQAPIGMVKVTVALFHGIVSKEVRKVK